MVAVSRCPLGCIPTPTLQARFLALLPRIELHGRIYFRQLRCRNRRDEALQEMRALAWRSFVRLIRRGKDPVDFPTVLASFAARAVRNGRRLCGQEKPRDVLSTQAQRRHGFTVDRLPDHSTLSANPYAEALHDNTRTPPPEQVAFRCDFPAWRRTRSQRDRKVIDDLMVGSRTLDIARKYGLTPARISQMRREFQADWSAFCGEGAEV
jgi:hypothetical protein